MSKTIKLKLNAKFHGKQVGDIISIEADEDGVPFNRFWRRRLADAMIDNCVEIVKEEKESKETKTKKGE